MKNFVDFIFGSLLFWIIGFGLMFGTGGFVGAPHFFDIDAMAKIIDNGLPIEGFLIFQTVFCATSATIVSGAMGIAANNIHTVLMPVDRLLMASELTLASAAGASCAQRVVGTRNNKVKANLRHDFFVPLNIVVVIMFYNVFEDVVRVIMLYVLFLCE